MRSDLVNGRLQAGTLAAIECCYGAELYDPAAAGGKLSLCNTYLFGGAAGFFGSSNIAYGPASGQGSADIITQRFLIHALQGVTLGQAALEARHEFIGNNSPLDVYDLKTAVQFNLLGDPSLQPVNAPAARVAIRAMALQQRLVARGRVLEASTGAAYQSDDVQPSDETRATLTRLATQAGLINPDLTSYAVRGGPLYQEGMAGQGGPITFHAISGLPPSGFQAMVAFLATEQDQQIINLEEIHAH
jgi:hypothetical protein